MAKNLERLHYLISGKKHFSGGLRKLINHFKGVLYSPKFQKEIERIRRDHKIKITKYPEPRLMDYGDYTPRILEKDIGSLLDSIGLHGIEWEEIIYSYIKQDEIKDWWFYNYGFEVDLCNLTTIDAEKMEREEWYEEKDSDDIKYYEEVINDDRYYPIILKINPHASMNDIYDFLKKNKRFLLEFQEKYKNKNIEIGKYKFSRTLERDKFIFDNSALPRKEIVRLVKKKFKSNIDEIYIRNIISKQKKRIGMYT